MPSETEVSAARAAAVAVALVASLGGVGVIDSLTGASPDLTILYLMPLLAATYYFGLRVGLTAAFAAVLAQTSAVAATGASVARALLDGGMHALVFALAVVGTDMLLGELRTIRRLEALRGFDLDAARRAHESVIGQVATERADIDVIGHLRFIREVGGDYYWFEDLDESRSFLCVADIAGKGVSAALFTALLDQSVRDAVRRSADLGEIVRRTNQRISDVIPPDMFVTAFSAIVEDGRLWWLNAGHEPGLLWHRRTGTVEPLQTQGAMPLGVSPVFTAEAGSVPLEHGDVLLALTDGVTESPRLRDAGRETLKAVFHSAAAAGHNAEGIVDAVCREAVPDEEGASDDVAILCLRYVGEEPAVQAG